MQNFIKRIIIIPVLLSLLAAGPIKCSDLDMATDGICENCFEGMSRDSVYTVIYCYGVGKNTNISILQLMNTSVPVLLKAKDVALYRDDVALPVTMYDGLGKKRDSIFTTGHDIIGFDAKVGQIYKRAPKFSIEDEKRNPIIRLVQRRVFGDSLVFSFDLNQDTVMIKDIRFFDLLYNAKYVMDHYVLVKENGLISDTIINRSVIFNNEKYKKRRSEIMQKYSSNH
jgi:hypothetical protein